MKIEVFKITPTERVDMEIAEGQFVEISDEEIIRLGRRYFKLMNGNAQFDTRGEE